MTLPPPIATRLAYAGLLPMILGTVLAWLLGRPEDIEAHAHVMRGLSLYATVLVSSLGALHWGVAMQRGETVAWPYLGAVLPALAAWVAALMPAYAGLVVHGVLLVLVYLQDRRRYPLWGLGAWLTLRFRCTLGASLCCFLAAAAT